MCRAKKERKILWSRGVSGSVGRKRVGKKKICASMFFYMRLTYPFTLSTETL